MGVRRAGAPEPDRSHPGSVMSHAPSGPGTAAARSGARPEPEDGSGARPWIGPAGGSAERVPGSGWIRTIGRRAARIRGPPEGTDAGRAAIRSAGPPGETGAGWAAIRSGDEPEAPPSERRVGRDGCSPPSRRNGGSKGRLRAGTRLRRCLRPCGAGERDGAFDPSPGREASRFVEDPGPPGSRGSFLRRSGIRRRRLRSRRRLGPPGGRPAGPWARPRLDHREVRPAARGAGRASMHRLGTRSRPRLEPGPVRLLAGSGQDLASGRRDHQAHLSHAPGTRSARDGVPAAGYRPPGCLDTGSRDRSTDPYG